jgi:hypothetical protein
LTGSAAADPAIRRLLEDIPCGIYDPEEARIEAESCYKIIGMYEGSDDALLKARCIRVKEERAELVKHHLDVLWHDYIKPEHLKEFPPPRPGGHRVARPPPSRARPDGLSCRRPWRSGWAESEGGREPARGKASRRQFGGPGGQ